MNFLFLLGFETLGFYSLHLWEFEFSINSASQLGGHFSQTRKVGNSKNPKSGFFLMGLKYILNSCFEFKNVLLNSRSMLRNQVRQFLAYQIY